ncbi:hypothetical protein GE107_10730 [Cohnella sp. CFH 77786]|uniref:putative amidoligase domain-containing protein n=1 Tax=Cohnella sp. CFH 77786 TaxID=2662265 RepID=UPI001C60F3A8|nr:hypothetical protein [Cohnella sp. CFH 77786]MBW5446533.1 hypothetical protein [Cohnella sp. CFH 77786]
MKTGAGADLAGRLPADEIVRRLRREGFRFDNQADGRTFSVTIYDLEATDVRRVWGASGPAGKTAARLEPDDRLRRIVTRAASRTLLALGLDEGQVLVGTDEGGRPWIAGISGTMRPSPGEGEARTERIRRVKEELAAKEKELGVRATLGADPEFLLQAPNGRVVPASRYLPPDGSAGCDSVVRRGVRLWPLVELRPEPAEEPAAVADAIGRLLAAAARKIGREPLIWRAGAWPVPGLPLGGHVHLSGAALTSERLRALDNAVALPLRLLEPPGAAARRPRYGALGDFRRQPHGGFEYRTPPSWLVSRRLALGVLSLAKIAAEHAGELAGRRPLDEDALRDAFYGTDRAESGEGEARLRKAALGFYEELRRTAGYRKYAEAVDFVYEAVAAGRKWDETADIRAKWGIPVG